jgi:type I restriction enzyme R subunit
MAHDQALSKVMQHLLKDDTKVYKEFVENESFKRFVGDMVYALTNQDLSAGSMGTQSSGNM